MAIISVFSQGFKITLINSTDAQSGINNYTSSSVCWAF